MNSFVTRNLPHTLTHWGVTTDGYGGFTYDAPVTYSCRWESKNVMFVDSTGEEVVSNAVAMLASELEVGDYVAEGDQTSIADPTTLRKAYRIKQANKVTDLRNTATFHKVFL